MGPGRIPYVPLRHRAVLPRTVCSGPCQNAWKKEIGMRDRPPYAKPLMQEKVSSPGDEQGWLGGRPSKRLPCPMRSWYRSPECLPLHQHSSILQLSAPTMENSVCVLHGVRRRLWICCRTKSIPKPLSSCWIHGVKIKNKNNKKERETISRHPKPSADTKGRSSSSCLPSRGEARGGSRGLVGWC